MAHIVIMPRQGNTVESCVIVGWNKKEGDQVQADTPLCDVETDKATFEVAAGAEGTLLKILHEVGDDVPVLQPIAVIGTAGEDWQAFLAKAGVSAAGTSPAGATTAEPAREEATGSESALKMNARQAEPSAPASPRARNLAAREALNLNAVAGTGPGGRIIERDVQAVLEGRPPMTAAARAAMAGTGVGAAIPGEPSGIGGRLRVSDLGTGSAVQGQTGVAASSGFPAGQSSAGSSVRGMPGIEEKTETPIKGIRKLISDRMLESLASTAQFTLNSHARSDRLLDLRQRFKASHPELGLQTITVNDLILFAVSRLLPLYPFMNAHKLDDKLITYRAVHLGMAVDTPRGLMVPVIRNADQLSLAQISAEAKRLAAACQQGNINPDELTGSTFTVTNLGALGIESFTPVINIPEVAILGVCGMELKPLAKQGAVTEAVDAGDVQFVPHIGLSLTINHQVVDGAPAARFLKALCDGISQIDLWLAR
jgi:pyruvate dehydrogenase E2 component (dihydrolipoamide acetyltransferase)